MGAASSMPDTLGSLFGFLINVFRSVFHIILLLLHNLVFIAIGLALLYGIFKLGQAGVRQLRGRGAPPQRNRSGVEQAWPPATHSQSVADDSQSAAGQNSQPAPEESHPAQKDEAKRDRE